MLFVLFAALSVFGANSTDFSAQGDESLFVGALPGDQVAPDVSINSHGGYVVWQDLNADGEEFGISARRLNSNLLAPYEKFRVNQNAEGSQENPQVALLHDGGAVLVWENRVGHDVDIFARFLTAEGIFAGVEFRVNEYDSGVQNDPVVSLLNNGNVVIAWTSSGQDGSMKGVYARLFSPEGAPLDSEFPVNETTQYNQRNPGVGRLEDGGFVLVWISEKLPIIETSTTLVEGEEVTTQLVNRVHVFMRRFSSTGAPVSPEVQVSTGNEIASLPDVAGLADGGFSVAWTARHEVNLGYNYEVIMRHFDAAGAPRNDPFRVNQVRVGPQYEPRIQALGNDLLVVWTSVGQEGSQEDLFARFVSSSGDFLSDEVPVNTVHSIGKQIHPSVASDGSGKMIVTWASYMAGTSFDIFSKRYFANRAVPIPEAPYVRAASDTEMLVTWTELSGFAGLEYLLYLDDGSAPAAVTSGSSHRLTGLQPGSHHTVRIAYRFADQSVSLMSAFSGGATWGSDTDGDGVPDDWQRRHWGESWPSADADSDGDGASNRDEFLAGTRPDDPASVLRHSVQKVGAGMKLHWSAQPGSVFRIEKSHNLTTWSFEGEIMAADSEVWFDLQEEEAVAFYRIVLQR